MCALLCIFDLLECSSEALRNCGLGLCSSALETLAELRKRGWGDEEVDGVQVRRFYLPDALERVFGRKGRQDGDGAGGRTCASMSSRHRRPEPWTARTVMKLVP